MILNFVIMCKLLAFILRDFLTIYMLNVYHRVSLSLGVLCVCGNLKQKAFISETINLASLKPEDISIVFMC